jgi:hypothetical protein
MRYGIVTAKLGEYADPRVAVRLARAAGASWWLELINDVSGPLDETMARVKAGRPEVE